MESRSEPLDVFVLNAEEYAAAVESTLAAHGYTREQLADQAAHRDFDSPAAFMLWHTVRDNTAPTPPT